MIQTEKQGGEQKTPPPPPMLVPSEPLTPDSLARVPWSVDQPGLPSYLPPVEVSAMHSEETPARVVYVTKGDTVSLPFDGTGWIYLGEQTGARGLHYITRQTTSSGQLFLFQAESTGEFLLKFYHQDFLRDNIINDYIKIISDSKAKPVTPAKAPDLKPAESAPVVAAVAPSAAPAQVSVTSAAIVPPSMPAEDLATAQTDLKDAKYADALTSLNKYREAYPAGSDEAWWMYGQCYEAPGSTRDIRSALGAYQRLVRDFPQSSRKLAARNRIAYLERFYFYIR
jgi:hypothetical protein